MNALLLVAHGSRRQLSNDEVAELAEKLKVHCVDQYNIVHHAFLELAEPLIPDGIKQCADDGAKTITILPYFLNTGFHVAEDIPEIVQATLKNYPNITIKTAAHLGASEEMITLLVSSANAALNQ